MTALRFAILGTGFWARYQLADWRELPGVRCVAHWNRTRTKADALTADFGVPGVQDDPAELFVKEKPDFVDIITDVGIVDCQRALLRHLSGQGRAETTGEDNLNTVRLVSAAYDSAASGETARLPA